MTAVLFDLDGTLHNRSAGLRVFASDHAWRLGVPMNDREKFVDRFLELDANGKVWKDVVYAQLRREFESSSWPSTELLEEHYVRDFPRFAVEEPGSTALLQTLNGRRVQVGIVTNGRSDLQRSVIEALRFNPLVNTIVVSEEVGYRKPQREIYELALASLASDPRETMMVGDDPVADIEGAVMLGIYPIAFRCASAGFGCFAEDMESVGDVILKRLAEA